MKEGRTVPEYVELKLQRGKWKGIAVTRIDSGYLQWLLINAVDWPADVLDAALRELHRRHTDVLERYGVADCIGPLPKVVTAISPRQVSGTEPANDEKKGYFRSFERSHTRRGVIIAASPRLPETVSTRFRLR